VASTSGTLGLTAFSMVASRYNRGHAKGMKTAISIPDPLFRAAEREAARRKISRSRFYSMAIDAYLKSQRARRIRQVLDAVYAAEDSALDPGLDRMQSEALGREDW
jgi:metal-responsive CopG/Arc/MetJ family transcriptional regulator